MKVTSFKRRTVKSKCDIGTFIDKLCIDNNIKYIDLARYLNVSKSTIYKLRVRIKRLSEKTFNKIYNSSYIFDKQELFRLYIDAANAKRTIKFTPVKFKKWLWCLALSNIYEIKIRNKIIDFLYDKKIINLKYKKRQKWGVTKK